MKLGSISEIRTGMILSRKRADSEFDKAETYKLIAIKNVDEEGLFNNEPFEDFDSNDKLDQVYFTKEGDILFRLSHPYTALYIGKLYENLLIPSHFAKIRIKDHRYLPEYVAWYLNREKIKRELLRYQTGSVVPTTNIRILSSLRIKAMDKAKQESIINYNKLYLREKSLLKRLMKENERLNKAITNKLIGGKDND